MEALLATPAVNQGLAITTSYVPGINPLGVIDLHPSARLTGLFMQPRLAALQARGLYRHLPVSYGGFVPQLNEQPPFDVAIVQLSPPDPAGRCSFGPCVEFAAQALARARHRIAVINPCVPVIPGAASIALDDLAEVIETTAPLPTYALGDSDDTAHAIARHLARFIPDGVTLQTGLGKIPGALLAALHDRRRIKLHSGMISDGIIGLHDRGALAPGHTHRTCALVGSSALYQWAASFPNIAIEGCDVTHDLRLLSTIENFVAINSAIEVDLLGQCNLEFLGGRAISGPGGAPDFAAAARRSPGGLSIVALPATSNGMTRIRARLGDNALCTLPRTDIDIIVTEHGAADLRFCSVHERAERLIEIAAPPARPALADEWAEHAKRL